MSTNFASYLTDMRLLNWLEASLPSSADWEMVFSGMC